MIKSKKTTYKFWHSPLALAMLFIVLVLFGYKIIFLIEKQKETTFKKEQFLNEIISLKDKESSLLEEISKIETEEGKEEIIRGKYQVVKDGERMVTIVNEEKQDSVLEKENNNHGFWNWLKRIFSVN